MATTTQFPTLFLSHSGEQKDFVWSLYRQLQLVNHSPFFDQDSGVDSLPKGSPFPSQIVEACRACKLGLVVLSHDYIESLWPMLELEQLLFHNPLAPHNVYPIFYKLKPADLSDEENLKRWRSTWQKNEASWHAKVQNLFTGAPSTSTSYLQPTLDISLWPKALETLRSQSGDALPNNKDGHAFIQTIVSNICKRFPPPQSLLMGDHFKGADHIPQEIHKLFQEQEERRREIDVDRSITIAVGMHGVGGSGKTTVCKYMVNFYSKDYPGSCCFLQFPTKEDDKSELLVQSMKDFLFTRGNLAKEILDSIKTVDQAMSPLQELLRRYKVFLILDNVWDWALQVVKQIVKVDFKPESRLLVTARSAHLLERLIKEVARISTMKIVHVPSISEEEAIEALMAYSSTTWYFSSRVEDLRGLARSCFFGDQCHPLLLKAVGARLRHVGGHTRSTQDWVHLISRLQAHKKHGDEDIETTVVSVLKTSYDALRSKLQDTFLKLGICAPRFYCFGIHESFHLEGGLCEWLMMISRDASSTIEDIRDQLIELEYHGLVQIPKGNVIIHDLQIQGGNVIIHDLQMMLIENIMQENNGEPRCFLFHGDDVATLSAASEWRRLRYIYGTTRNSIVCKTSERRWLKHINGWFPLGRRACMSPSWKCIEVLYLQNVFELGESRSVKHTEFLRLSVEHMHSLRHLVLNKFGNLKEVGGWHGAPNLTSVSLIRCGKLQVKVESMACLSRLESLVISCRGKSRGVLKGANDLAEFLGHLPKLRELDLANYKNNWVNLGTHSASYTSLQRCCLQFSGILELPSLNLIQLRVLDLSDCKRLQSMEGRSVHVCSLTALEELWLQRCRKLERIPDLKLLVNLRVLKLEGCHALKEVKVGDAAPLTSLELNGCRALKEVKVGDAAPLTSLELYGCHALKKVEVGDAAVTSLERLSLHYGYCHLSTVSCAPLPISAFTNLRRLEVWGDKVEPAGSGEFLRMELPASLEELELTKFETGGHHEITHLSRLRNLRELYVKECAFLTSLSAHALPNLRKLRLWRCASLTSISGLGPALTDLLGVSECASLTSITGLSAHPSLMHLHVEQCASLTSIPGLFPLPNNMRISNISGCKSLKEVGRHWEPPFNTYRGKVIISFTDCPHLEMLSL